MAKRKAKVVESARMFELKFVEGLARELGRRFANDPKIEVLGIIRRGGGDISIYLSTRGYVDIRKEMPPIAMDIDVEGVEVHAIDRQDGKMASLLAGHALDACKACEPWPGYFDDLPPNLFSANRCDCDSCMDRESPPN